MSETIEAIVLRRNVSTVAQLESGALALNTAQWGLATAEDTMVARDDAGNFHYFYGSDRIEAEIVSILAETDHNDLGGRTVADCHPISAITGLTSTLADKLTGAQADLTYMRLEACDAMRDPTGWVNPENLSRTYDPVARTVTITTTDTTLQIAINGIIRDFGSNTWTSSAHGNTAGTLYHLYSIDGVTFSWSTTIFQFYNIPVASILYVSPTKVIPLNETHGLGPWNYHKTSHWAIGTIRDYATTPDGGTVNGYVLGSTTEANRRPGASAVRLLDEDLPTMVDALPDGGPYSHLFLSSGTATDFNLGSELEIVRMSGTAPQIQNPTTGAWSNLGVAKFANVYLIALPVCLGTVAQQARWLWMQGQAEYGNLGNAQAESFIDVNRANLNNLFAEFLPVAKVTIKAGATYFSIEGVEQLYGTRASNSGVPASAVTTASAVSFVPVGNIASTNVQAAIAEVESDLTTLINAKAPIAHASAATTYGVGSTTNYGHVKLYTSTGTSTDGAMDRNSVTNALDLKANAANPELTGTVLMGTAANGLRWTNYSSVAFGVWRRSVSVPDNTNYSFFTTTTTSDINATTSVGLRANNGLKLLAEADYVNVFTGGETDANRITFRNPPSSTANAIYMGTALASQTANNYKLWANATSTVLNAPSNIYLSVNDTSLLWASATQISLYQDTDIKSGTETHSRIRLSTNIDSLNYVGIGFGAGTSARDTYLYRLGVNALSTPGSLNVNGEFTTNASVSAAGSILCTNQFRIGVKNTVASASSVDMTGRSFVALTGTTTTTLTGGTAGCLYVIASGDGNGRTLNVPCQGGGTKTFNLTRCVPIPVIAFGSGVFEPLNLG